MDAREAPGDLVPLEFWPNDPTFDPDLLHPIDWLGHALDPAGLPAQPGHPHPQQLPGLGPQQQQQQLQHQAQLAHVPSGNALAGLVPSHDPVSAMPHTDHVSGRMYSGRHCSLCRSVYCAPAGPARWQRCSSTVPT